MPQTIIQAKNYKNRDDIDKFVGELVNKDTAEKPDFIIKGKRAELEVLRLCDKSTVWGIKCQITDTPSEPKKNGKVKRDKRKSIYK